MSSYPQSIPFMAWVRMFEIPQVSKHKDGFTIYQIVSFLYPEACPDAVTKLIVWKRFNDFKKLHEEIKKLHSKHNIEEPVPSLPRSTTFWRFSENTINQRKQGILNLLEYIGHYSEFFTSLVFVRFFETSYTPLESLTSNITNIRAELNLPEEQQEVTNNSDNEEDKTVSDTDSFASSTQVMSDSKTLNSNLKKLNSMTSIDSQSSRISDTFSLSYNDSSMVLLEEVNVNVNESTQYLVNASMHINMAMELEKEMQHEEAFSAYKTAVDILINGGQDDSDYDRKRYVKYKTEKYLIRAEKIYNMYLAPEVKGLQLQKPEDVISKTNIVKGPLYNLYRYKVIRIISQSGMLVLHLEEQQIYFIKVIHKSVQFSNSQLILPENVPYMVKLVKHFSSDNAIFLVLEYCSGQNLRDYLNDKSAHSYYQSEQFLKEIQSEQYDSESEISFSELVASYSLSRAEQDEDGFEIVEAPSVDDVDAPADVKSDVQAEPTRAVSEEQRSESATSETQIIKWMSQLLVALEKLHSLGVVCKDLSIDNILVDERGDIVLTYMCNVKEMCELYSKDVNCELAPEIYGISDVTEAVDWWSFGTILYELLVGMPLSKLHANGLNTNTHLMIPKYVSIEGRSLLKQLLVYEPQERLGTKSNGIQHLKAHPFFRNVCWNTIEPKMQSS